MSWPPADSDESRELRDHDDEGEPLPFGVPSAEASRASIRQLFAELREQRRAHDDPPDAA